jgi:mono/diheme cytochrome c family protein
MNSVEFPVTVVEPSPPAPTEPPPPPAPTEPPPPEDNVNGSELYGKYCASCHGGNGLGGVSEENVVGAHPTEIMEAIKDDEGGMGALDYLKPEEIQAISDWLRRGLPDPRAEKDLKKRGKKIYKAYCGSCHGKKGAGGSAKSILGEDAQDIMEAKHGPDDEVQKFLAALIDNGDIAALVKYLDYEEDKYDYKTEKKQRKQGKKDYKTYCQACHGKKGRGEPYSPLIGTDADSIADALTNSYKMEHQDRAQRFESADRIESLVAYLNYEYEKYLDKDDDDDDDKDDDEKDDD